jgi:hypothetical protein
MLLHWRSNMWAASFWLSTLHTDNIQQFLCIVEVVCNALQTIHAVCSISAAL